MTAYSVLDSEIATTSRMAAVGSYAKRKLFEVRATAFIRGEFSSQWIDYAGAPTEIFDAGFNAGATFSIVSSGRSGGQRIRFTGSGANAFHQQGVQLQYQGSQAQAILAASMPWDAWYVESGVIVRAAPTGAAEVGFCGLCQAGGFALTDGASTPYVSLGITAASSTTTLTLRTWATGSTLVLVPTSIPIEIGIFRRYALANDGMGTFYFVRDGVIMGSAQPQANVTELPGCLFRYERSNAGGTYDVEVDYYGGAAASP